MIFALDATMSRQPTWDTACRLQAEMFEEAGQDRRPRRAARLFPRLQRVPGEPLGERRAGAPRSHDQHRLPRRPYADRQDPRPTRGSETAKKKVSVLVFVGDALEEADRSLAAKAGELGLLGRARLHLPGRPRSAGRTRLPRDRAAVGGAYARFDTNAGGPAGPVAAGGGGLCRRRPQGARQERRRRRRIG